MSKPMAMDAMQGRVRDMATKFHKVQCEINAVETQLNRFDLDASPPRISKELDVPTPESSRNSALDDEMEAVPLDGEGMVDPPIQI